MHGLHLLLADLLRRSGLHVKGRTENHPKRHLSPIHPHGGRPTQLQSDPEPHRPYSVEEDQRLAGTADPARLGRWLPPEPLAVLIGQDQSRSLLAHAQLDTGHPVFVAHGQHRPILVHAQPDTGHLVFVG